MLIKIDRFEGMIPRVAPHQLPDTAAQYAHQCDFSGGVLRGAPANASMVVRVESNQSYDGLPGRVRSMFIARSSPADGQSVYWTRPTHAVRSPVVSDAHSRYYFSNDYGARVATYDTMEWGRPKCMDPATGATTPAGAYLIGVPRPGSAPTALVQAFGIPGVDLARTEYSFANERGDHTLDNEVPIASFTSETLAGASLRREFLGPRSAKVGTGAVLQSSVSEQSEADAPNVEQTVATDAEAAFVGPVVKLRLYGEGGELIGDAIVRGTGRSTSWPAGINGFTATLIETPTGGAEGTTSTYTLSIAALASNMERRAYTLTYVNQWGEEGPPSTAVELDVANGSTVIITHAVGGEATPYAPITKARLYRTATGATGSDYLQVKEYIYQGGPAATFTDNLQANELGRPLSTYTAYPPPPDMKGLVLINNGMLAGFKGNQLVFCQPYLPYACDPSTIKPLPHAITGICPIEGGLFVTTVAEPYLVMGSTPDSMTDARVPAVQAGVNSPQTPSQSMANVGSHIAYLSHDGIVMARGLNASLDLSSKLFTRQVWRKLFDGGWLLQYARVAYHDGALMIWLDDINYRFIGGMAPAMLLRMDEGNPSLTWLSERPCVALNHDLADALYIGTYDAGANVTVFRQVQDDTWNRQIWTWQSKRFVLPDPACMAVLQIYGQGAIDIEVRADQRVVASLGNVSLDNPQNDRGTVLRLPAKGKARTWEVKLTARAKGNTSHTDAEVSAMLLASSMEELRGG